MICLRNNGICRCDYRSRQLRFLTMLTVCRNAPGTTGRRGLESVKGYRFMPRHDHRTLTIAERGCERKEEIWGTVADTEDGGDRPRAMRIRTSWKLEARGRGPRKNRGMLRYRVCKMVGRRYVDRTRFACSVDVVMLRAGGRAVRYVRWPGEWEDWGAFGDVRESGDKRRKMKICMWLADRAIGRRRLVSSGRRSLKEAAKRVTRRGAEDRGTRTEERRRGDGRRPRGVTQPLIAPGVLAAICCHSLIDGVPSFAVPHSPPGLLSPSGVPG
ncbi:hypothetical protein BD309DRAFT_141906 [Dichomitus squalens]|nr:hypothetical protein BD309DRAFT_141906 [Dichomitus squalens]